MRRAFIVKVQLCVCEVRPGQRPSLVLCRLRRALVGLQVQVLEDVDLSFDADLQERSGG